MRSLGRAAPRRRSELAQVAAEDRRPQPVQRHQHLVPRADQLREDRGAPQLVGPGPGVLPAPPRRLDDRAAAPEERPHPDVLPGERAAGPADGPPVQQVAEELALLLGHLGQLGELTLLWPGTIA